jgi:lipoprotein-releasing system permease protein
MNITFFLAEKIKNTKNQTFSSLIIKIGVASIAISISVLLISFFVLFGFKNTIKQKLFGISSHIQISKITLNRSFEEASMPNNLPFLKKIENNPEIKSINKVGQKSIILKSEEEISGVVLKGVDENYDWSEFETNIIAGRKLSLDKDEIKNEVIISEKIRKDLNLKLNDDLLVYFIQDPPRARKLKIVGIYDTNVEELDQVYVLGDLKLIQKINGWDEGQYGHLEIFINDLSKLDILKEQLLDQIPVEFQVLKITEILPQFFDWFNLLDRNILMVIVLILVVAAFNMISVLLIMIMERTPMVGLLKSIGTSNRKIQNIFLINGSKIIIRGMIWGNIIGFGLCFLQAKFHFIKLDAANYYMSFVPIEWDFKVAVLINIGIFMAVLLVLIIPTWFIQKINPVKALKYKD